MKKRKKSSLMKSGGNIEISELNGKLDWKKGGKLIIYQNENEKKVWGWKKLEMLKVGNDVVWKTVCWENFVWKDFVFEVLFSKAKDMHNWIINGELKI